MKSLILAALFTVGYVAAITIVFNVRPVQARAVLMAKVFILTVPIFVITHLATPADLGILPAIFVEHYRGVDMAFGLLLYVAGFGGGVLQLYNLADRGFSLRMLIDIGESPGGVLDLNGVMKNYSQGNGIEWMYQKRVEGMREHELITVEGKRISITDKGRRTARTFAYLRKFLGLDERGSE